MGDALDDYLAEKERRRVAKYAKQQCCVCGKYGADEPFSEPLRSLQLFAKVHHLTLKLPQSPAIHPKCLQKLKGMLVHETRIQP